MGPSPEATVDGLVAASPLASKYAESMDRESAYEKLAARMEAGAAAAAEAEAAEAAQKEAKAGTKAPSRGGAAKEEESLVGQVVGSGAFKSMLRSAGTVIGREISRSIFGTGRRR